MSVWDDDAGMPRYQVPRFHMIAVMRSDTTTQTPYPRGDDEIVSSGRRWMIPMATVIPPMRTPRAFIHAARRTE